MSLSEHLKAIQFEIDLEQQRKSRYLELEITKEQPRDFLILKRIIQLYDKLTTKYKNDMTLWKQYLAFCFSIRSKKNFFKAVSEALRFNDKQLGSDLIRSLVPGRVLRIWSEPQSFQGAHHVPQSTLDQRQEQGLTFN